jgi:hypothetical protein
MQRPGPPEAALPALLGAIPSSLQYGVETSAGLPGSRSLRNFGAESAGIYNAQNNTIRINVTSSNFLDLKESLLTVNFKNTSVATDGTTAVKATLDGGCASMIQRIRILNGNNAELERMENYNLINNILDQYTVGLNESLDMQIMSGTPEKICSKGYSGVGGDALGGGIARHYEFGLKCGWFNPTLGKLLPPNCTFVLEITLADPRSFMVVDAATSVPAFEISNTYLKVPVVRVDDMSFMQRVETLRSRGTEWSGTTYKHHGSNIEKMTGHTSLLVADRSSSLTGLITVFRFKGNPRDVVKYGLSSRSIQYADSYHAQIGGDLYPPAAIRISTVGIDAANSGSDAHWTTDKVTSASDNVNVSECYSEAKRVFPGHGSIGRIEFGGSEVNYGAGVFCIDTKAYHSEKRNTSGVDTASQAVPVILDFNITNKLTETAGLAVDVFAKCDVTFIMMPGGELRSMA